LQQSRQRRKQEHPQRPAHQDVYDAAGKAPIERRRLQRYQDKGV
jgi:hypothetical protein